MKLGPIPCKGPPAKVTKNGRRHRAFLSLHPIDWPETHPTVKARTKAKNGENTYEETFSKLLGDEQPELFFRFRTDFEDKVRADKDWDEICDCFL